MYVVLTGPLGDDCREASWILNPRERERERWRDRRASRYATPKPGTRALRTPGHSLHI